MAERLSTTHSQAHIELRWTASPAPNFKQAIVEDITDVSEEATYTCQLCKGFAIVADYDTAQRKRHATEDRDDRSNKRARLADMTGHLWENDISTVPLGGATGSSRGHAYQNVLATGNASVHMGDQHIVNNNYSDPFEGINIILQRFWNADPDERDAIVHLAASVIAVAALHAMVQRLFRFIGRIHPAAPGAIQQRAPSLLSRIGYHFAIFEDAFGRTKSIDIDILTTWTAFHKELIKDFKNKPGHSRVAVAQYRLLDQAQGTQPIDPRRPPPFASVFARRRHVRMSMHFEWDEVSLDCCPKCRRTQTYELDKETVCVAKTCGFSYRGYIEELPIVELDEDDDEGGTSGVKPREGTDMVQRTNLSRRLTEKEQENPALFSRITVSRQPENAGTSDDQPFDAFAGIEESMGRKARVCYKCPEPYCGKSFEGLNAFETHRKQHLEENPDDAFSMLFDLAWAAKNEQNSMELADASIANIANGDSTARTKLNA